MTAHSLAFQSTQFDAVDRNGHPWLRANQIGLALEYKNPELSINKLYRANADEFTDAMTALVELVTNGGKQKVRIFSLRGAHLLAMFARTKIAKEFRKWALNILDKEVSKTSTPNYAHETVKRKDMDNIARAVWMICNGMHYEQSWTQAIWHRLRKSTGCTYPNRFRVDHLPIIEKELKRIHGLVKTIRINELEVEQQIVKRVLRGDEDEEKVIAEMNQLLKSSISQSESELRVSMEKWEEYELENLSQRRECGSAEGLINYCENVNG